MTRIFWFLFLAATVAGLALPFLPPGSWPWWDSAWILVFFVAAYAELVIGTSLSAARMAAGIIVISLAVILGLGSLTGWPVGPLRFTEHSGLRLGGALPLVLPLFGFSLLSVSRQAVDAVFPSAGRAGLAAATATAALLTLLNSLTFFISDRLWWLWNPWGDENAIGRAVFSLSVLGLAAVAGAWVLPVDSRLRTSRWTPGVISWISTNVLFLVARLA
jgi:uncharacterized membrane protein